MFNAELLFPSLHILQTEFLALNPVESLSRAVYLHIVTQMEIGENSDHTSLCEPARLDSYQKESSIITFCSIYWHVTAFLALARVIKCSLQFCVSQIQLNLQKSDYDSNWEVDRKVMELAMVNLDKKTCHDSMVQSSFF